MNDFIKQNGWITDEVILGGKQKIRDTGAPVRKIQEHLVLQGYPISIDGIYGPETERAVKEFQKEANINVTGIVGAMTWAILSLPLRLSLSPPRNVHTRSDAIVRCSYRHLARKPREVGGPNAGPWVRLYMKGYEGRQWLWCAGFVSFIYEQAFFSLEEDNPIDYTFSCDNLAAQGKKAGRFVEEGSGKVPHLAPGSIMLIRKSPGDWFHTGIVIDINESRVVTIEGNTNLAGSREGIRVLERKRSLKNKDFIEI